MAFSHGINGVVFLNGADVRSYLKSFTISREQDTAETSVFALKDKQYIAGMRGATISLEGFFDGSTVSPVAIDKMISDLLDANGANYVACLINTDAIGSAGYATTGGYESSYEINTSVEDAASISLEVQGSGALDRILSLHPMQAETGATGNTTQIDNVTSSALGARGHLYFASTDGSIVVKIQHSVDGGGGGTWVDLLTFTAATGRTSEIKEYAAGGTINRYVRIMWTRTGGTTGTFFVGFRRGI